MNGKSFKAPVYFKSNDPGIGRMTSAALRENVEWARMSQSYNTNPAGKTSQFQNVHQHYNSAQHQNNSGMVYGKQEGKFQHHEVAQQQYRSTQQHHGRGQTQYYQEDMELNGAANKFLHSEKGDANVELEPTSATVRRGGGRSALQKNVMALNICEVVQHREEDGPLTCNRNEVGFISLVGQVMDFEDYDQKAMYRIEDKTGSILLIHYKEHDSATNHHVKFRRSDTIRVVGTYNPSGVEKFITVIRMWHVIDQAEIDFHKLLVLHNSLRSASLDRKVARIEQDRYSGKLSHSLQMTSDNIMKQSPDIKFPGAAQVMEKITSCYDDNGASLQYISSKLRMESDDVKNVLDFLLSEGYVYNTCDEHHYKCTE